MTRQRRQPSGEFKAKVVLEALRGERPLHDMAGEYGVHPLPMTQWKKVAWAGLPTLWSSRRGTQSKEAEARKAALYQQSGQLKVALAWLKNKVGLVR